MRIQNSWSQRTKPRWDWNWCNSGNYANTSTEEELVEEEILYSMLLTSTGTGAGVSTLKMQVASDIIVTLSENATFYTDAGGTLGASQTWDITSGALRTIFLKCTTGTATMTFSDITKVTKWGDTATDGWTSGTNAARVNLILSGISNLINLRVTGTATFSGAMPTEMTYLYMVGNSIVWTYSGAMPVGLTLLLLTGNGIEWTYNGALPVNITYINLSSTSMNWTGLSVLGSSNITNVSLTNYRITKMTSVDMVSLLTSMTNRVGTLPAIVTINDYADYASPPIEVTNAVATLKSTKSITTVNLGA